MARLSEIFVDSNGCNYWRSGMLDTHARAQHQPWHKCIVRPILICGYVKYLPLMEQRAD